MEKKKWMEEVMQSMQNKEQVDVPGSLEQRIQQKLSVSKNVSPAKIISIRWIAVAAVAACLLIMINYWSMANLTRPAANSGASIVYNESLTPDFSISNK